MDIPKKYKNNKTVHRIMDLHRIYLYKDPLNSFMKSDYGRLIYVFRKISNYLLSKKLQCPFQKEYFLIDDKLKNILDTKQDILKLDQIRALVLKKVKLVERNTRYI